MRKRSETVNRVGLDDTAEEGLLNCDDEDEELVMRFAAFKAAATAGKDIADEDILEAGNVPIGEVEYAREAAAISAG